MSKHSTVAIEFSDLLEAVSRHGDSPWYEVIGHDDEEMNAAIAQAKETGDDADWEKADQAENDAIERLADTWWHVAWPQHVSTAQYDSDASFHGPVSKQEAVSCSDEVYGEF